MYLIIIFGFVSVLRTFWQKTATEIEISLFFHLILHYVSSKLWHDYYSNNRMDTLSLLIVLSENIYYMWSIIVLL